MKLVASNEPAGVKKNVSDAITDYKKKSDASSAISILAKLKGIGPATASLLLAVHFPDRVPFFSDEMFYWLCGGGKVSTIKYNTKEYQLLNEQAAKLTKRLGVKAVDAEKVAFVLFKRSDAEDLWEKEQPEKAISQDIGLTKAPTKPALKRKAASNVPETTSTRRSKRGKE
jgi:hypothetical protein